MNELKNQWEHLLGEPTLYDHPVIDLAVDQIDHPEFDGELHLIQNGPNTVMQALMVFPKGCKDPVPGVVVPFYYPDAMVGYDLKTGEELPGFKGIEMLLHLVRRGYAAVTAESYHLTYIDSRKDRSDFTRWHDAAEKLLQDHPRWSGMGKLVRDTEILTEVFVRHKLVNGERLAIAGHSLGGKMAFYAGCLDERFKVILASDFGIGWDQTNWRDIWYWGDMVDQLKEIGIDHSSLLGAAAPRAFCLLAGQYDDETSGGIMRAAPGYEGYEDRLLLIHHGTGHRPPADVLEEGYRFIDKWI